MIRPENGSAIVLNTKAAVAAPSTSIGAPFFAGEGTPSTSRSRRARVPRFFVATPQATGKTSPRVTASLSAPATSSTDELLALEVALHQALVGLHDLVEQLLPVLGDDAAPCRSGIG